MSPKKPVPQVPGSDTPPNLDGPRGHWFAHLEQNITKEVRRHVLYDPEGMPAGWYSDVGYLLDELDRLEAPCVWLDAQGYHLHINVTGISAEDAPWENAPHG